MKRKTEVVVQFVPEPAGVDEVLRIPADVWLSCVSSYLKWKEVMALATTCKTIHASLFRRTPFTKNVIDRFAIEHFGGTKHFDVVLPLNELVKAFKYKCYIERALGCQNDGVCASRTKLCQIVRLPQSFYNTLYTNFAPKNDTDRKQMSTTVFVREALIEYGSIHVISSHHSSAKARTQNRKKKIAIEQKRRIQLINDALDKLGMGPSSHFCKRKYANRILNMKEIDDNDLTSEMVRISHDYGLCYVEQGKCHKLLKRGWDERYVSKHYGDSIDRVEHVENLLRAAKLPMLSIIYKNYKIVESCSNTAKYVDLDAIGEWIAKITNNDDTPHIFCAQMLSCIDVFRAHRKWKE